MTASVSVLKIDTTHDIEDAIREGFNSMGELGVGRDDKIVIKPNLCAIRPPRLALPRIQES